MRLNWEIRREDVAAVEALMEEMQNNAFVISRRSRNLTSDVPEITRPVFWKSLITCLVTSQQRSGPNSPVYRFISQEPFPIGYETSRDCDNLILFVSSIMRDFGGLRRYNRIAIELKMNLDCLEQGLWSDVLAMINELRDSDSKELERKVAHSLMNSFKGIGCKQSRNFLQDLGIARYEIPIDSRITRWLNQFGFPIKLSSAALSDPSYYDFIIDGILILCNECNIYPCEFDAAVFASFDREEWSEDNV